MSELMRVRIYNIISIVTIFLIVFFSTSFVAAEDLYVRPNGGSYGTENGSNWTNAFDGFSDVSWGDGAGNVSAGDTLYVAGGTYTETLVIGASGTYSETQVTVKRATTSEHGTDTGWSNDYDTEVTIDAHSISIQGRSYIMVDGVTEDGFHIISSTINDTAVYVQNNCSYITLQYITIDGATNGDDYRGIRIYNSNHVTVRYCVIENMPNDAFVILTATDLLIEYCHIGPKIASATGQHGDGIEAYTCSDVTFRYNTTDWAGDMTQFGMSDTTIGRWDIHGNIFTSTTSPGSGYVMKINSDDAPVGPMYFYNNTFYQLYLPFLTRSANTTGEYKNNIFYNNTKMAGSHLSHSYNYYGTGEDIEEDNKQVGGNPFVSTETFVLGSGFSAKDMGVDLGRTYNTDGSGNTRGRDGYWDMGAYELAILPPRNLRLVQ